MRHEIGFDSMFESVSSVLALCFAPEIAAVLHFSRRSPQCDGRFEFDYSLRETRVLSGSRAQLWRSLSCLLKRCCPDCSNSLYSIGSDL